MACSIAPQALLQRQQQLAHMQAQQAAAASTKAKGGVRKEIAAATGAGQVRVVHDDHMGYRKCDHIFKDACQLR